MSNYAPNRGLADPNYDYIAPCGATGGEFRPRRVMVPKINPQSVFVPIPARSHPHQPQLHHLTGTSSGTSTFHRTSTWNNQETLALTQRLWKVCNGNLIPAGMRMWFRSARWISTFFIRVRCKILLILNTRPSDGSKFCCSICNQEILFFTL